MKTKKIILLVVEGKSEENAIGPILNKLIENESVKFKVINGDLTSNYSNSVENISLVLEKAIKAFLGNIFIPTDIKQIIHITDTDGTFIENKLIKEKSLGQIEYFDSFVVATNKYHIEKRNNLKSTLLNYLKDLKYLNVNGVKIPYQIYFMSCNLDHVLYNERNLSRKNKTDFALDFSESYYNREKDFINFIGSKPILVGRTYLNSWDFIKIGNNSLLRGSNLYFFLKNYK